MKRYAADRTRSGDVRWQGHLDLSAFGPGRHGSVYEPRLLTVAPLCDGFGDVVVTV